MSNVNIAVVSGNITRDPEVKWQAEDGSSAIVSFGLASNRSRKNAEGEYIDEVSFFDIDVFGGFANLVARKLRKGDAATVMGRLEQQKYEKDGEQRSVVKIIAQQIDSEGFFRSKDEEATPEAPSAEPKQLADDDDIPF